ncbi:Sperm-associated antigen 17, partial [Dissostichus eleginoides]
RDGVRVNGSLKDGLPHWSQLSSNVSQQETAAPIWPSSFLGVGVLKCFSDLFDTD